jgi:DNA-binding NarL/FixJ family response regulator
VSGQLRYGLRSANNAESVESINSASSKFVSDQIKQHSIDEARHARYYIAILDLTFPGATNKEFHSQLETLSPGLP